MQTDKIVVITGASRGIGAATEVAEAIYWLASQKFSFVTGGFVDIAGGL